MTAPALQTRMLDFGQFDFGQFDFGRLAEIEIGRSRNWPKSKLTEVDRARFKHHQNFTKRPPKEGKERKWRRERKKQSEFLGGPAEEGGRGGSGTAMFYFGQLFFSSSANPTWANFYLGQFYLGQVLLRPILLWPILLRPILLRPGAT